MEVRPELRAEERTIDGIVRRAFDGRDEEPELVAALRAGPTYLPELSLVALRNGSVVGFVMLTTVELVPDDDAGPPVPVLALAPLAVDPDHQDQGVGAALVDAALRRASRRTEPFVVVLGSDRYYPRFGFVPAASAGIKGPFPVPDEHFMIRRLPAFRSAVPGTVRYPPPFGPT
jgi:putative acetyltransferase